MADEQTPGIGDVFSQAYDEGGLKGALETGVRMFLPQSFMGRHSMMGAPSFKDMVRDYVDWSPGVGDALAVPYMAQAATDKTLSAGDRAFVLIPALVASAGLVAAGHAAHAARKQRVLARAAQKTDLRYQMGALPGQPADYPRPVEQVLRSPEGLVRRLSDMTPEEQNQFARSVAARAFEFDRPGFQAMSAADTFEDLAVPIRFYEPDKISRVSELKNPTTRAEMDVIAAELRGIGHTLVDRAAPGTYAGDTLDAQAFVAAKLAIMSIWEAVEQEKIHPVYTKLSFRAALMGLLDGDGVARHRKVIVDVAEKLQSQGIGPDLVITPQMEVAFIDVGPTSMVTLAEAPIVFPARRVVDRTTWLLLDSDGRPTLEYKKGQLERALATMDGMSLVGDEAVNVGMAMDIANGVPHQVARDSLWYMRANRSIHLLNLHTGYGVQPISGFLAALSPQNAWVPDNIVAGTHMLLHRKFGLDPSAADYAQRLAQIEPEYRRIVREVLDPWKYDLAAEASSPLKQRFGDPSLAKKNRTAVVDYDGLVDYWTDPRHARTQTGRWRGTSGDKDLATDAIIGGELPWYMVLRASKTHIFAELMADPNNPILGNLAVIDAHSNRVTLGTLWVGEPLGSQTTRKLNIHAPDFKWEDPFTRRTLRKHHFDDAIDKLVEHLGWDRAKAEQYVTTTLASVPSGTALRRYRAQMLAHVIYGQATGMAGHEVQSTSWGAIRNHFESRTLLKKLDNMIDGGSTDEQLGQAAQQAVFSTNIIRHAEGNPDFHRSPIWFVSNLADDPVAPVPPFEVFPKGKSQILRRPIITVVNPDGTQDVWARLDHPDAVRLLRHAAPSGLFTEVSYKYTPRHPKGTPTPPAKTKTFRYYRMVNRRPQQVDSARVTAKQMLLEVDPDGIPVGGEARTVVGLRREQPGNSITFEVSHPEDAADLRAAIEKVGWPLEVFEDPVEVTRRIRPTAGVTVDQLLDGWDQILDNHEWGAISATDMAALERRLHRAGATAIPTVGRYMGNDEASFFVTGISYDEMVRIAREFHQESIATRHGLLFVDGDEVRLLEPTGPRQTLFDPEGPDRTVVYGPDGNARAFSYPIDFNQDMRPVNPADLGGEILAEPRRQVTVDMGGVEGGPDWNIFDRVWAMLRQDRRVKSLTARTHGGLWDQPGTVPVTEFSYFDGTQTSTVRRHVGQDLHSLNQTLVWIPEGEAALLPDVGGKSVIRTADEMMAVGQLDAEMGKIRYPEVSIDLAGIDVSWKTRREALTHPLRAKIGGKIQTEWHLDLNSRSIRPGHTNQLVPGMVNLTVSNRGRYAGRVDLVDMADPSDVMPAMEALRAIGLDPKKVNVDQMRDMVRISAGKGTFDVESSRYTGGPLAVPMDYNRKYLTVDEGIRTAIADRTGIKKVPPIRLGRMPANYERRIVLETVSGLFGGETNSPTLQRMQREFGTLPPRILEDLKAGIWVARGFPEGVSGATMSIPSRGRDYGMFISYDYLVQVAKTGGFGKMDLGLRKSSPIQGGVIEHTLIHEFCHRIQADYAARWKTHILESAFQNAFDAGGGWDEYARTTFYRSPDWRENMAEVFTHAIVDPNAPPAWKQFVRDIFEDINSVKGKLPGPLQALLGIE